MAKPVTGPDGDNPISDEQIGELIQEIRREYCPQLGAIWTDIAAVAAGQRVGNRPETRAEAVAKLAVAWNARHGSDHA